MRQTGSLGVNSVRIFKTDMLNIHDGLGMVLSFLYPEVFIYLRYLYPELLGLTHFPKIPTDV